MSEYAIEAAAKAIYETHIGTDVVAQSWNDAPDATKEACRRAARAAIAAYEAALSTKWICAARNSTLPEPIDCNWPLCGCDPGANKVVEALQDCGWQPPAPPQEG